MMEGYKLLAEGCKALLKEGNCSFSEERELREKIQIYEFLSEISQNGKYVIFDSAMFNDIFKGYIKMIMDELTEAEDIEIQRAAVLLAPLVNRKAGKILDQVQSKQAEEYYHG